MQIYKKRINEQHLHRKWLFCFCYCYAGLRRRKWGGIHEGYRLLAVKEVLVAMNGFGLTGGMPWLQVPSSI
jgi:hypothetical protein